MDAEMLNIKKYSLLCPFSCYTHFLRYALIRYKQSLCLLIPGAFQNNSFAVFVNRLDVCGLLGQAYSGECLDLICGFESQRYTVFCCLAFFYAGRG